MMGSADGSADVRRIPVDTDTGVELGGPGDAARTCGDAPEVVDASNRSISLAVRLLRAGRLVALPTETVYGLAADASNPDAVARVFAAKDRPTDHPLIVHLSSAASLASWARRIPPQASRLAEAFWPGSLTMVLERHRSVLDAVTGGPGRCRAARAGAPGRPAAPPGLRRRPGSSISQPFWACEPDDRERRVRGAWRRGRPGRGRRLG